MAVPSPLDLKMHAPGKGRVNHDPFGKRLSRGKLEDQPRVFSAARQLAVWQMPVLSAIVLKSPDCPMRFSSFINGSTASSLFLGVSPSSLSGFVPLETLVGLPGCPSSPPGQIINIPMINATSPPAAIERSRPLSDGNFGCDRRRGFAFSNCRAAPLFTGEAGGRGVVGGDRPGHGHCHGDPLLFLFFRRRVASSLASFWGERCSATGLAALAVAGATVDDGESSIPARNAVNCGFPASATGAAARGTALSFPSFRSKRRNSTRVIARLICCAGWGKPQFSQILTTLSIQPIGKRITHFARRGEPVGPRS